VHAELMLAGPLASSSRLAALELMLARGRASQAEPESPEAWLGRAFGLEALPAGALTAGEAGFWVRADPVHYRVLRDRIVMLPVPGIDPAYAAALLETLNAHFAGQHEFRAARPDAWAMRTARAPLEAPPPAQAAGVDLAARLPGAPWTALLNEIQMALHEHPASEGRSLEVNGVWLWGAGELPAAAASRWRTVTADEPLALGLARAAGIGQHVPPPSAGAWLEAMPEDGRHLVALGPLRDELEPAWFAPLLAALKSGRIGMLTLHAPQAGVCVETARMDLRRFWRRPRALAPHAPG
jgi:hypothetical protein